MSIYGKTTKINSSIVNDYNMIKNGKSEFSIITGSFKNGSPDNNPFPFFIYLLLLTMFNNGSLLCITDVPLLTIVNKFSKIKNGTFVYIIYILIFTCDGEKI